MSQDTLQDGRDLGAFIPSALDDYGLDVYEFRIYSRIVRRAGKGNAWESVSSMAKACKMGEQKVKEVIRFLISAGMIERESRSGQTSLYKLLPQQKWVHPETLDLIRDSSSYHPGVKNTQVLTTPGWGDNPGVIDTQEVGVDDTWGVGVDDTHKGIPMKGNQEGTPNKCGVSTPQVRSDEASPGQKLNSDPSEPSQPTTTEPLSGHSTKSQATREGEYSAPAPTKSKPKKRRSLPTAAEVYPSLEHLEPFNKYWGWFCKRCRERRASPGSKIAAAIAWRDVIESDWANYAAVRRGTVLWFSQNKNTTPPHCCRFITGSENHPEPYWQAALDRVEEEVSGLNGDGFAEPGDDFNPADPPQIQIGKILKQQKKNGVLPPAWQQKTGCLLVTDLDDQQSMDYLNHLRQLEVS